MGGCAMTWGKAFKYGMELDTNRWTPLCSVGRAEVDTEVWWARDKFKEGEEAAVGQGIQNEKVGREARWLAMCEVLWDVFISGERSATEGLGEAALGAFEAGRQWD